MSTLFLAQSCCFTAVEWLDFHLSLPLTSSRLSFQLLLVTNYQPVSFNLSFFILSWSNQTNKEKQEETNYPRCCTHGYLLISKFQQEQKKFVSFVSHFTHSVFGKKSNTEVQCSSTWSRCPLVLQQEVANWLRSVWFARIWKRGDLSNHCPSIATHLKTLSMGCLPDG